MNFKKGGGVQKLSYFAGRFLAAIGPFFEIKGAYLKKTNTAWLTNGHRSSGGSFRTVFKLVFSPVVTKTYINQNVLRTVGLFGLLFIECFWWFFKRFEPLAIG